MGIASQECCDNTAGLFGNNWIWIVLIILFCCGGFGGSGCAGGNILGGFLGNNSIWIILLIVFFFCFCGKRIF